MFIKSVELIFSISSLIKILIMICNQHGSQFINKALEKMSSTQYN
jgi:hypothetical protein